MVQSPQRGSHLRPWLEGLNAGMVAFDLGLGVLAIVAPRSGLRLLGHRTPSDDAAWLFRRCGPIWLTFAAAHLTAARRGAPRDWWALGWLRGAEIATDALWAQSPAFREDARARWALRLAGVANTGMALGFGRLGARPERPPAAAGG